MSHAVYCEFTCDLCGTVVKVPHNQHPQRSWPDKPREWGAAVIEGECRRELCGQCMSRVRCLLGAHLDVEVGS